MPKNLVTPGRLAKWTGLQEAITACNEIGASLNHNRAGEAAREAKKVYMRAAMKLVTEAQDLAPFNPDRKQGTHLRDAIYAAYGPDTRPNVIVNVNYKKAPHAWLEEHGTKPRSTKAGKNRGSGPAQPFMRPALAATRPIMLATIQEGLELIIAGLVEKYGA